MQRDGVGPARLGELDGASLSHAAQLLCQLVNLPLSLGVYSELVLHRDSRQLLPEVPDLIPQVNLVLGDGAGHVEKEVHHGLHELRADSEGGAPQQQKHETLKKDHHVHYIKSSLYVC